MIIDHKFYVNQPTIEPVLCEHLLGEFDTMQIIHSYSSSYQNICEVFNIYDQLQFN